jgi:hypothetical protein
MLIPLVFWGLKIIVNKVAKPKPNSFVWFIKYESLQAPKVHTLSTSVFPPFFCTSRNTRENCSRHLLVPIFETAKITTCSFRFSRKYLRELKKSLEIPEFSISISEFKYILNFGIFKTFRWFFCFLITSGMSLLEFNQLWNNSDLISFDYS